MDPRKLLHLACVIEQGSFKEAARHLLISPPALSSSIERLEKSLGGKVLERSRTGISPTVLGELLYEHARSIRDEIALAERRLRDRDKEDGRPIIFGTLPSLATTVIPTALCRWRMIHPKRPLKVVDRLQGELLSALVRKEVDFIVGQATDCYSPSGIERRIIFRDEMLVLGRPGHPARFLRPASWTDLAQFPWISPIEERQRALLEILLISGGVDRVLQLIECPSLEFIKSLIVQTNHLAMLPTHTVSGHITSGRLRPLDIAVPHLNIEIAVMSREESPVDEASADLVAQIAAVGAALVREQAEPAIGAGHAGFLGRVK